MSAPVRSGAASSRAQLGTEILERVAEILAAEQLDALVATSAENVAYSSGAAPPSQRTVRSRLAAAVLPAAGDPEVITVMLERPLVVSQTWVSHVTPYVEFEEHPIDAIVESLRRRGLSDGRVGVEITHLCHADFQRLQAALPAVAFVPADELWSRLRMYKTPAEIEAIRYIGQVADEITKECVGLVGPGDTERDLGDLITDRYLARGGDALTMLVVAAGERSAHLNGPPTDRRLQLGDVVRTDVIGTAGGYYSDVARTAVVGSPTAEQQRIFDVLRDTHERCLEALRPGARTSAIYGIYHDAMERLGLPAYHFVGHGLGVTLHEEPFVSGRTDITLEPGMVLCIEPLTSVEGEFGMQIEDEILITADGAEPLTRAEGLLEIGR